MKRKWLPDNVTEYTDRHGRKRYRWRRAGYPPYSFKSLPGTPEFLAELAACQAVEPRGIAKRAVPGSFDDLAARFYASTAWQNMKPITRSTYRNIIERFREKHGTKPVALMTPLHLDAIIAKIAQDRPGAATNLRKTLKRLLGYAVKIGMVRANAADHTDPIRSRSDGYHCWTEDQIAAYRASHALGTRARLAMELLLWTGQRRADVVGMGRQHVKNGRIRVRQEKTGKLLWIKIAPQLRAALDAMPPSDAMLFLTTQYGRAFTAAGFGNWFRDQCDAAGLRGCTAHGLRKAMARRGAELLATNQQLKAVGGWSNDSEVATYTASADQIGLADSVIDAVSAWDIGEPPQG